MKKYHACIFCKQEFYGSKFLGELQRICPLCKSQKLKFPISQATLEKRKQTNLKKYGVENPSQCPLIKKKIEKTTLEKYGVKNASQSPIIKEKIKQNNLRKYGVESHNKLASVKEKKKKSLLKHYGVEFVSHSKEIREKIKKTNLRKYGCEYTFQNPDIKDKIKKTNLERYGSEYPMSNPKIMEKSKQTFLKKYGVTHPTKLKETQEKKQETNLKKYGVKNPLQSEEIKEKTKKTNLEKYGSNWNLQSSSQVRKSIKNNYINGKLKEHLDRFDLILLTEFTHTKDVSEFQCKKCKHIFTDTFTKVFQRPYACPKCKPQTGSIGQKEVNNFLRQYIITEENVKNIIPPKELDIYIPSKKVAIEFDGLYWHSEKCGCDKNYHLNKTLECEKKNIQLIHIFEDEWMFKKEIVKSRLKQILNVDNKTINIKEYIIKEIDSEAKNNFLETYNIQGKDKSTISLGAFNKEELISVMTFLQDNVLKDIWELNRSCSKSNFYILDVKNKLLKYFQHNFKWRQIFSYIDRRWFNGNDYKKLGFKLECVTQPKCWYIQGMKRVNNCIGNKIWDCGYLKFACNGGLTNAEN